MSVKIDYLNFCEKDMTIFAKKKKKMCKEKKKKDRWAQITNQVNVFSEWEWGAWVAINQCVGWDGRCVWLLIFNLKYLFIFFLTYYLLVGCLLVN